MTDSKRKALDAARYYRTRRDTLDEAIRTIDGDPQRNHEVLQEARRKLVMLRNAAIDGFANAAMRHTTLTLEEEAGE